MSIQRYINKMKNILSLVLQYIDCEYNYDSYFNMLKKVLDQKIRTNKYKLQSFLSSITSIGREHRIVNDFFKKLFKIVDIFRKEIISYYSNEVIYEIFHRCYRLLLYVIEEKILKVDFDIANKLKEKYYFYKEVKPFIDSGEISPNYKEKYPTLDENYEKNRRNAVNESKIASIIREDSFDEFISYVKENKIDFEDYCLPFSYFDRFESVFSIPEYVVLSGSTQIFEYLLNQNKLKDLSDLFFIAVQSNNPEMIFILEENFNDEIIDEIKQNTGLPAYIKAIESFHNDIAHYVKTNYNVENEKESYYYIFYESFNYEFVSSDMFDDIENAISYGDIAIVSNFMKTKDFDINKLYSNGISITFNLIRFFYTILYLFFIKS